MQLCVLALVDRDLDTLQMAAETFWRAQSLAVKRAQKKWRKVSRWVDLFCRVIYPCGYTIFFATLFSGG